MQPFHSQSLLDSELRCDNKEIVLINDSLPCRNQETSFYGHCNELSSFPDCSAREEEKIYEDLCYVTFSSTLPQVSKERINHVISFCVFFISLLICSDTVSP